MNVKFDFGIGDIVCYKQGNISKDDVDLEGASLRPLPRGSDTEIKYRVISRIYEEITPKGRGLKSYALRHMNSATPGSGDIYKFREDELILASTLHSLKKLVEGHSPQQKELEMSPRVFYTTSTSLRDSFALITAKVAP